MSSLYLGFDTSNYTTSTALVFKNEYLHLRRILEVKEGMRGLRQSDALFCHIKNMPDLYSELLHSVDTKDIKRVGVSTRPRSVEGSYMPVFLAGIMQARCVADTLGVPLFEFSHQDGHIMAGVHSSKMELEGDFLSVHMSGGTTEILSTRYNGYNFDCKIVGATLDISAGQVIDRVGVSMGMKFPCGKELDMLSADADFGIKLPVCTDGGFFNLSGLETKAVSLLNNENKHQIARGVFEAISETLEKSLGHLIKETKIKRILIAGGVASNSYIRQRLAKNIDAEVYFASGELSSDNAVGIALCAKMAE